MYTDIMHIYKHTCIDIYVYISLSLSIYIYIYMYMCIYIYIYIYVYAHPKPEKGQSTEWAAASPLTRSLMILEGLTQA